LPKERVNELVETLANAFDIVTRTVTGLADEHSAEFARDTHKDPVLSKLEPILHARVGTRLDQAEYDKALREAKSRAELKQPPGYKDSGKSDGNSTGDYFIWVQVIREARSRQKDVLLITGDIKEDWWRREHGEIRGPRPELVQEIKGLANVKLFMLRPESLLLQARQVLNIDVHDESVQDAERVDRNLIESSSLSGKDLIETSMVRLAWDEVLEAVKSRRRVAWILLKGATVESLTQDTITLRFSREGEAKGFAASGHATVLRDVLYEMLNIEPLIVATSPNGIYTAGISSQSVSEVSGSDNLSSADGDIYADEPPF
jgi:hypothetical protein